MSGNNGSGGCARTSWIVAAIVGALTFVLLIAVADWRGVTALIAGVLLFAILGVLFNRLLCSETAARAERLPERAAAPSPKPAPPPAPTVAPEAVAVPSPAPETAPEPVQVDARDEDVQETVRPTAHLAGEAELAERRGSWTYTAPAADPEPKQEPAAVPASEPAPEPVHTPAVAEPERPRVQPSTVLAGEAELASRKGSWRYTPPAATSGGE